MTDEQRAEQLARSLVWDIKTSEAFGQRLLALIRAAFRAERQRAETALCTHCNAEYHRGWADGANAERNRILAVSFNNVAQFLDVSHRLRDPLEYVVVSRKELEPLTDEV